jgi:hypothetical protein
MFSALRSRGESAAPSTRRRFAEADDASASSSAILDTDEQEKVVQSLERQASNAAKTWRVAFGVAASLGSLFFARLAALATALDHAATRDVAWSQPVHVHAYHAFSQQKTSLSRVRLLDVAPPAAPAAAAAARTLLPHGRSRGHGRVDEPTYRVLVRRHAKSAVYVFACVLGACAARGWMLAFAEAAKATEGDDRAAFVSWRREESWVPALAALGAPTCFAIDHSLERTVREARALRRHMYRHKRA